MIRMTCCFIKLLSQLPNILKTNGGHIGEKVEAIHTILDCAKVSGHATQNLVLIRKKILLSDDSSENKDLAKFFEYANSYLNGQELADTLKRPKESIIVCRHSNLKQTTRILQLYKSSMKLQKQQANQKTHDWSQGHPTVQLPKYIVHGQSWRNNQEGKTNTKITKTGENGGTVDQETSNFVLK